MEELPLSIALAAVVQNNKILLIKRACGEYAGLWGLPGGKIEKHEHLSEAVIREVIEESGIKTKFKRHLAVVSEHLVENCNIARHFLLHICELIPSSTTTVSSQEGKTAWFSIDELEKMKDQIIPSDFQMVQKIIKGKERKNYYNCVLEKVDGRYLLKKFE